MFDYIDAFHSQYTGEPNTGCWLWLGPTIGSNGYGVIRGGRRYWLAHHVSYSIYRGPLPSDGLQVLHKCDVPICVNPDHLWIGTHLDNMRDKVRKGRQWCPPPDHLGKLAETDVIDILRSKEGTMTLAKRYRVVKGTITNIRMGRTWKETYARESSTTVGVRYGAHCKLTAEQVVEIRRSSELHRVLAERYHVSQSTISEVKAGRKSWKYLPLEMTK